MNQKQLQYFLTVYEKKSISQAAESLFISPQGLSKTISTLESELGVDLFIHKSNRIIPTSAATSLASHAINILSEYDIIENKLFKNDGFKKAVNISCSYDVPQMFPIDFFHHFYKSHPDILLQMHEYPDGIILNQLDNATIELGIVSGPLDNSIYEFKPLFTDTYCLVINKANPLSTKEYINLADLQNEPLVIKDMFNHISMVQFAEFQKNGVLPNIILETSDSHLIHSMADNNYAIGMTLQFLANKIRSDNIVIRPFKDNCFVKTLYLVYRKNYALSYEAQLLHDILLQTFQ